MERTTISPYTLVKLICLFVCMYVNAVSSCGFLIDGVHTVTKITEKNMKMMRRNENST